VFNLLCLGALLSNGEWLVAIDASFARKSRRTSYGLDWFWNGSQGQAERGLEIAMPALVDVTHNTAYTLSAYQPPALPKAPRVSTVPKEVSEKDEAKAAEGDEEQPKAKNQC